MPHAETGCGEIERSRRLFLLEEADDLVAVRGGADEVRVRLDVREQRLRVLREPEEPRPLLVDPLDRSFVHRAVPAVAFLDELTLGVERLAPDAVPTLVGREVDVLGVPLADPLPQVRDHAPGRVAADEPVALDADRLPRLVEARRNLIHELLRRQAALGRRFLDLLAVLVGAGETRRPRAHPGNRARRAPRRRRRRARGGDVSTQ